MEQEVINIINVLAEKLGTTAEYLWAVLTKQAIITAATLSGQTLIMISVSLIAYKFGRKHSGNWDEILAVFYWVGYVVFAGITFAVAMNAINVVTTALANPEYWALKQLIK